jgi:hypothetical protein
LRRPRPRADRAARLGHGGESEVASIALRYAEDSAGR